MSARDFFDPIGEEVTCPYCGKEFYTEERKDIVCPHCDNEFSDF